MSNSKKKGDKRKHEEPVKIKGNFLDVFKVVKKNKEQKKEQPKK
jgi:hypothetical protein